MDEGLHPVTRTPARPAVELVLPGTWMKVPVGDRAREEALLDWMRDSGPDGASRAAQARAQLDQLAYNGGDLMMLRQDRSTLLVTAWPPLLPPPAVFTGGEAALQSLRAEAGGTGVPVESEHGFHVIRVDDDAGEAPASTYWIAHPRSGRILILFVTDYDEGHASTWLYDAVAGAITWRDRDPLRDPG